MASLFNKRYKTYRLQDVTEDMILNAEKYFDVKLPGDYIALLKEQNGGTLKFNEYPIVGSSSQGNKLIIDHIMGIGANDEEGILQTTYYLVEMGPTKRAYFIMRRWTLVGCFRLQKYQV
ncbi:SMI1/KNR4 family protein [Peribacillus butanolivorans]|uniref:SMI1/KNR4 family protein n=1 Tax=Peribacillus butanolivorans TaxID=421767 RepID=UPI0036729E5B